MFKLARRLKDIYEKGSYQNNKLNKADAHQLFASEKVLAKVRRKKVARLLDLVNRVILAMQQTKEVTHIVKPKKEFASNNFGMRNWLASRKNPNQEGYSNEFCHNQFVLVLPRFSKDEIIKGFLYLFAKLEFLGMLAVLVGHQLVAV